MKILLEFCNAPVSLAPDIELMPAGGGRYKPTFQLPSSITSIKLSDSQISGARPIWVRLEVQNSKG
jgi:hypothetical protein